MIKKYFIYEKLCLNNIFSLNDFRKLHFMRGKHCCLSISTYRQEILFHLFVKRKESKP